MGKASGVVRPVRMGGGVRGRGGGLFGAAFCELCMLGRLCLQEGRPAAAAAAGLPLTNVGLLVGDLMVARSMPRGTLSFWGVPARPATEGTP